MTAPELRFRTEIVPFGPAAAIMLTEEQASQLSTAKQPPVIVTVGERSARLRVTRMGGPVCIGLSKASRTALGIELRDEVDVTVALDTAQRTVEIPPLLAEAFAAEPEVKAAFDALSYTRRKEIAVSIAEAKQETTRLRRLERALSDLRE